MLNVARWQSIVAVTLIIVVGWLAYMNSFDVPFVYDDLGNIVTNESIKTFDFSALSSYRGARSLPEASLAFNYRLGELNVFGYHVFNWIIHIAAGVLLYWLSIALAKSFYGETKTYSGMGLWWDNYFVFALFVALIFVCHPLTIEAVTYVVQRNVSMVALFYILALAAYVKFRTAQRGRLFWAIVSVAASLLAMHSKQIAFTIPIAIVWIELCFFSTGGKKIIKRLPYLVPWLLLLLYLPWIMFGTSLLTAEETSLTADISGSADEEEAAASGITPLSRGEYLLTQFSVLLRYLQLMIFPLGQSIDHGYQIHSSLLEIPVLAGLVVVVTLLGLIVWFWPRRRMISFGIGFFFITVAMESSIIPLLEVVAEYRLYLPLIGLALILGDILMWLHTKYEQWEILQAMAVLLIIVLAVVTFQRNNVWDNPISLWRDAIAKAPEKARPHNNLGALLLGEGEYGEAARHFKLAIKADENYAHARNNLGTAYGKLGLLNEAAREYKRTLELNPNNITTAINLSVIYINQGKWSEATKTLEGVVGQFNEKTKRDPRLIIARALLGSTYAEQQRYTEAAEQYEKVLDVEPNNETARTNLELVRARLRR